MIEISTQKKVKVPVYLTEKNLEINAVGDVRKYSDKIIQQIGIKRPDSVYCIIGKNNFECLRMVDNLYNNVKDGDITSSTSDIGFLVDTAKKGNFLLIASQAMLDFVKKDSKIKSEGLEFEVIGGEE